MDYVVLCSLKELKTKYDRSESAEAFFLGDGKQKMKLLGGNCLQNFPRKFATSPANSLRPFVLLGVLP